MAASPPSLTQWSRAAHRHLFVSCSIHTLDVSVSVDVRQNPPRRSTCGIESLIQHQFKYAVILCVYGIANHVLPTLRPSISTAPLRNHNTAAGRGKKVMPCHMCTRRMKERQKKKRKMQKKDIDTWRYVARAPKRISPGGVGLTLSLGPSQRQNDEKARGPHPVLHPAVFWREKGEQRRGGKEG